MAQTFTELSPLFIKPTKVPTVPPEPQENVADIEDTAINPDTVTGQNRIAKQSTVDTFDVTTIRCMLLDQASSHREFWLSRVHCTAVLALLARSSKKDLARYHTQLLERLNEDDLAQPTFTIAVQRIHTGCTSITFVADVLKYWAIHRDHIVLDDPTGTSTLFTRLLTGGDTLETLSVCAQDARSGYSAAKHLVDLVSSVRSLSAVEQLAVGSTIGFRHPTVEEATLVANFADVVTLESGGDPWSSTKGVAAALRAVRNKSTNPSQSPGVLQVLQQHHDDIMHVLTEDYDDVIAENREVTPALWDLHPGASRDVDDRFVHLLVSDNPRVVRNAVRLHNQVSVVPSAETIIALLPQHPYLVAYAGMYPGNPQVRQAAAVAAAALPSAATILAKAEGSWRVYGANVWETWLETDTVTNPTLLAFILTRNAVLPERWVSGAYPLNKPTLDITSMFGAGLGRFIPSYTVRTLMDDAAFVTFMAPVLPGMEDLVRDLFDGDFSKNQPMLAFFTDYVSRKAVGNETVWAQLDVLYASECDLGNRDITLKDLLRKFNRKNDIAQ